jgi:hypothetical protein
MLSLSLYSLAPGNLPIRGQNHPAVGRTLPSRHAQEPIRMLEGRRAGRRLDPEIKAYRAHPAAETWRRKVFVGLTNGWANRLGRSSGWNSGARRWGIGWEGVKRIRGADALARMAGPRTAEGLPRAASRPLRVEESTRRLGRKALRLCGGPGVRRVADRLSVGGELGPCGAITWAC